MDVTGTFDFNAPAENVYSNLTDLDRADRWLPTGARLDAGDGRRVHLVFGDERIDLDVTTVPEELRLTVRCAEPVVLEATARVTDTPAGGSRVDATVAGPDGGVDPATVRRALTRVMGDLRRDVDDSFTPG